MMEVQMHSATTHLAFFIEHLQRRLLAGEYYYYY